LVLFAYGAKRLPLGTLGFLGYLSPGLKFVCGWLIFKEVLSPEKMQAFVLIWIALVWYTAESLLSHRKVNRKKHA
jgi:chloramphenicol-sensitive protein RarD